MLHKCDYIIDSLFIPLGTRRTGSTSPGGERYRRVASNHLLVRKSVIVIAYSNKMLSDRKKMLLRYWYVSLKMVLLLPQSTDHIRTASLPCALPCEWQEDCEHEISV